MEVPVICAPLRRPVVPPDLTSCLGDLQFVEDYSTVDDIKVDIIIGLDAYWKFVKPNTITVPDSLLAAQSTVFGWMLYGSVPGGQDFSDSVVAHQLLCVDVLHKNIHAFWELESIVIPFPCDEKLRDPVLEKFQGEPPDGWQVRSCASLEAGYTGQASQQWKVGSCQVAAVG